MVTRLEDHRGYTLYRSSRSGRVPCRLARRCRQCGTAVNYMRSGLWAIVIASVFVAGCDSGPRLIPAAGTVTLRGQPVPDADIVFVPNGGGAPVIGRTDTSGKFNLNTNGDDGAYVGSYKVAVTAVRLKKPVSESEALSMTNEQIAANHVSAVPIKYNNTISSGLTATVSEQAKSNNFTFDLK